MAMSVRMLRSELEELDPDLPVLISISGEVSNCELESSAVDEGENDDDGPFVVIYAERNPI